MVVMIAIFLHISLGINFMKDIKMILMQTDSHVTENMKRRLREKKEKNSTLGSFLQGAVSPPLTSPQISQ